MPELRKDPVIGRWVIIATERGKRPSDYVANNITAPVGKQLCPFCPGNEDKTPPEIMAYRASGSKPNTPGWHIRVVPNKFPALEFEGNLNRENEGIYNKLDGIGAHEVIIETPDHKQTPETMKDKQLEEVLWACRDRIVGLKKDKRFRFILIFKNHDEAAGATLTHPHSQLIALPVVPRTVEEEIHGSEEYYNRMKRCIYCDIIRQEVATRTRIVSENEHFICITPYASRSPFETCILPKKHNPYFEDSKKQEIKAFSQLLAEILRRQDRALNCPPYNYILHSSPVNQNGNHDEYYHWHLEIMPRLTHIAGFEWGTGIFINPTSPEEAASFLRKVELE